MLTEGSVAEFISLGPIDHLFKGGNEAELFAFVSGFLKKYAKFPTIDTVEKNTKIDVTVGEEPWSYYFDILKSRHVEISLKTSMKEAAEFLQADNKAPDQALSIMTEAVMRLIRDNTRMEIVDFRDAYDAVIGQYAAAYQAGSDYGFQFGWPTIDEMSGGLTKGDMASIIGRPSKGKTWFSLYAACSQWFSIGRAKLEFPDGDYPCAHSRLFVSMEMSIQQIQQRLAAMVTQVPASSLKHAELTTPNMKKLKSGLLELKGFGAPFYIVDGNLASTVEDIWIRARQLKPDAIFIDGAYLLKHPTEKDRFRRVAENAELIKKELTSVAPTICSYQFAKSATKNKSKKSGDAPTLDDIGYSDAIAQVSSLVLGLLEAETIETINTRRISVLKGRGGESGSVTVHFDPDKMLFGEVVPEPVSELQFV